MLQTDPPALHILINFLNATYMLQTAILSLGSSILSLSSGLGLESKFLTVRGTTYYVLRKQQQIIISASQVDF